MVGHADGISGLEFSLLWLTLCPARLVHLISMTT